MKSYVKFVKSILTGGYNSIAEIYGCCVSIEANLLSLWNFKLIVDGVQWEVYKP